MNKQKGIAIVGAGNVAWHLAFCFFRAGIRINIIVNRSIDQAKLLAQKVDADFSSEYSDIPIDCDLVFICVSDSVVAEVAGIIGDDKYRLVHTCGSLPLAVLGTNIKNIGVFYPFQTFSKDVNTGELKFPVCLEANDEELKNILEGYATRISDKVVFLDSDKRKQLHLAGVILNNFANHLIARAFDFAEVNNIDTDLFLPILDETLGKIKAKHPREVQTGPAIRGNKEIIKKHLDLLVKHASLHNIYEVMSNSIEEYYSKGNK